MCSTDKCFVARIIHPIFAFIARIQIFAVYHHSFGQAICMQPDTACVCQCEFIRNGSIAVPATRHINFYLPARGFKFDCAVTPTGKSGTKLTTRKPAIDQWVLGGNN